MKRFSYRFRFKNRRRGEMKVWLAELPVHHGQRVKQDTVRRSPDQSSQTDIAGNRISYYCLKPGEEIENDYEIEVTPSQEWDSPRSLSETERAFYLRSTAFVRITDEIRELAAEICKGLEADESKACALFDYVWKHFRYIYPPKERGTVSFLRNKKGDCGEFSFFICRTLPLPEYPLSDGGGCFCYGETPCTRVG
ncbi:transglutaminase superfamily protein [Desmospora activa DSM 45169]|uniref:Transglutaminase superfamily protein n=1 Tax=Desmospora activa DSM 45169 TaxID=1121389 RepID=A0A2T4Z3Q0_9BACL|nr:transglutaminase domain-containing protein [Desmospora activa]PTM56520.1 transglutaminase superfamily protein [Desmospora activa DSM 45169]